VDLFYRPRCAKVVIKKRGVCSSLIDRQLHLALRYYKAAKRAGSWYKANLTKRTPLSKYQVSRMGIIWQKFIGLQLRDKNKIVHGESAVLGKVGPTNHWHTFWDVVIRYQL
jgi:hypothetical protein